MQSWQRASMSDACQIIPYQPEQDMGGYGDTINVGEPDETVWPCRLSHATGGSAATIRTSEGQPGEQTVKTEWNLRLPLEVRDQVGPYVQYRLVSQNGEELDEPVTFEQVGHAYIGPTAILAKVQRVIL